MQNKSLVVPAKVYQEIVSLLSKGKKIQAIKLLRNSFDNRLSLKEAKWSIDRMCNPSLTNCPQLIASPTIVAVTLDYGSGPIQLDLEEMQLRMLTRLPAIGLDACAQMLEIVEVLQAISEGKKVRVVEDTLNEIG
jgi:hypothetical protein